MFLSVFYCFFYTHFKSLSVFLVLLREYSNVLNITNRTTNYCWHEDHKNCSKNYISNKIFRCQIKYFWFLFLTILNSFFFGIGNENFKCPWFSVKLISSWEFISSRVEDSETLKQLSFLIGNWIIKLWNVERNGRI